MVLENCNIKKNKAAELHATAQKLSTLQYSLPFQSVLLTKKKKYFKDGLSRAPFWFFQLVLGRGIPLFLQKNIVFHDTPISVFRGKSAQRESGCSRALPLNFLKSCKAPFPTSFYQCWGYEHPKNTEKHNTYLQAFWLKLQTELVLQHPLARNTSRHFHCNNFNILPWHIIGLVSFPKLVCWSVTTSKCRTWYVLTLLY